VHSTRFATSAAIRSRRDRADLLLLLLLLLLPKRFVAAVVVVEQLAFSG
jgi:hypothetical protein